MQFAREFVIQAPYTKRDKMLEVSKSLRRRNAKKEEDRIATAIAGFGRRLVGR